MASCVSDQVVGIGLETSSNGTVTEIKNKTANSDKIKFEKDCSDGNTAVKTMSIVMWVLTL